MSRPPAADDSRGSLRSRIRRRRRGLEAATRRASDRALVRNILALGQYRSACAIAVYCAFDGEPSLHALVMDAHRRGKRVYAPMLTRAGMSFASLHPGQTVQLNAFGFTEPAGAATVDPRSLDLVLTPLVAFDDRGWRLGFGAGPLRPLLRIPAHTARLVQAEARRRRLCFSTTGPYPTATMGCAAMGCGHGQGHTPLRPNENTMSYWLMKSEPGEFGIDDLIASPDRRTYWDGVRNYQARNFMRDDMQPGDRAFFYHSSCPQPGVAGIVRIASEAYPDHTAFDPTDKHFDPRSDPENPRWFMVDIELDRKLNRLIALAELRAFAGDRLDGLALLRRGNRLSITPVSEEHWNFILSLE